VGRKLKSGKKEARAALSQRGPYTSINEKLFAKEIFLGEGEKRKRLVLVKNIEEEERQRTVRQEILDTVEEKVVVPPFPATLFMQPGVVHKIRFSTLPGFYIPAMNEADFYCSFRSNKRSHRQYHGHRLKLL